MQDVTTAEELDRFCADGTPGAEAHFQGIDVIVWDRLSTRSRSQSESGRELTVERFIIAGLPNPLAADLQLESRAAPGPAVQPDDPLSTHFSWTATNDQIVRASIRDAFLDALVTLAETYPQVVATDDWVGFGPIPKESQQAARSLEGLVAALPGAQDIASGKRSADKRGWRPEGKLPQRAPSQPDGSPQEWVNLAPSGAIGWTASTPSVGLLRPTSEETAATEAGQAASAQASDQPFCYFCGESVDGGANSCPACGQNLDQS